MKVEEEYIHEIVDEKDIIIRNNTINMNSFTIKDELCSDIFKKGNLMRRNVLTGIKKIYKDVLTKLNIDKNAIKDVILVGSIVSYHYSSYSDIDIHIIVDMEKIDKNKELVKKWLDSERKIWNEQNDVTILGYEVEIYFQDVDEIIVTNGIYSIMKEKWLEFPKRETFTLDVDSIKKKAIKLINTIEIMNKGGRPRINSMEKIWKDIVKGRKDDIQKNGEFGTMNIVFKILRRSGHLKLLNMMITKLKNKMISESGIDKLKDKIYEELINKMLNIEKR
jgi:predicted nucleotidyltransferase